MTYLAVLIVSYPIAVILALIYAAILFECHDSYLEFFVDVVIAFVPVVNILFCLWVLWGVITQKDFGTDKDFYERL